MEGAMKRTNVVLDEQLVTRGKRLTGLRTSRALIDHALREMVRRGDQRQLLELRGKVVWGGDLTAMRSARGLP
jgi:Arc/MetJ family transcription regulator